MWENHINYLIRDLDKVAHDFTEETEGSELVIYFWCISSYCKKCCKKCCNNCAAEIQRVPKTW